MNLNELLTSLKERDIQIIADKDRLKVNAPAGSLTPELQAELIRHKPVLLELLHASRKNDALSLPAIQPLSLATNIPLAFPQQRLWFLNQFDPNSSAYTILGSMELIGRVDCAILEKSIGEILRRHHAFRTVFRTDHRNQPYQAVLPPVPFRLPVVDLQDLPLDQREEAARNAIIQEGRRPFQLDKGPLYRILLYRLEPQRHWFLSSFHHIISDGWSVGNFLKELQILYQAFLNGEPSPLPELRIQYSDYAVWQRRGFTTETLQQKLGYWQEKLKGPLPILDLPADHPRPAVITDHGGALHATLPDDLVRRIKQLCAQKEVTLYMFLLAAFQVLLHRYTGQTDLIIGTPVANRSQLETENLFGLFVNTLPLRTDISGDISFLDLLARVRETALQAFARQDVPFEMIVEAIQPERHTSHTPIFQVFFILQNAPLQFPDIDGLKVKPLVINNQTSKFDLTLSLGEGPEGFGFLYELEYNSDLFEAATIRRMQTHFQEILEGACSNPDLPIHAIPLLTPAERHQILAGWNNTSQPFPAETLAGLFEAQVDRSPDKIAVIDEQGQLTYSELDFRANQLANHLRQMGVGPEVLVGIHLHRSVDMMVSLLAVLKAGGAYVPLDPYFPEDRLSYMLEDSGARVLLTQDILAGRLASKSVQVVCVDNDWPAIAQQSSQRLSGERSLEQLAYVIYTSGSTGRPKGVQVLQRGVVNFLNAMQREPGITAEDVLLSVTTLSFDIAGLELYLPLVSGAALVLASSAITNDGTRLAQALAEHKITMMQATPATWRLLIASGWMGNSGLKVLCGGEAFPPELAAELLQRCGSLWNMYGPTETTIWSTLTKITAAEEPITIGRPIANTSTYILDVYGQPVPIGIPGELYIGGEGVARGYLNRPELSAERFLPNPFGARPDERFYRTGDLCRFLSNGCIEYLGRMDNQVKLRGFRIELGEIESVLSEHPHVNEAVVVAREDTPDDKRLVAYLTLRGAQPSISELRSHLHEKIPDYMIPSAYLFLPALPLTPNGKVDRRALPAPELSRPDLATRFTAPRSDIERTLAEIWQEALKVDQVGINDNFFELGGHSLLIVQIHHQVCQHFQTDITIAQMFQYSTIQTLAQYLNISQQSPTSLPRQGIQERAVMQREAINRQRKLTKTGGNRE